MMKGLWRDSDGLVYSPALFSSCRRVAKIAVANARFAVERFAESEAHRTLFGFTAPSLTDPTAPWDTATPRARRFGQGICRGSRNHRRRRWCCVRSAHGCRSVHSPWRRNANDDEIRLTLDPIAVKDERFRIIRCHNRVWEKKKN